MRHAKHDEKQKFASSDGQHVTWAPYMNEFVAMPSRDSAIQPRYNVMIVIFHDQK